MGATRVCFLLRFVIASNSALERGLLTLLGLLLPLPMELLIEDEDCTEAATGAGAGVAAGLTNKAMNAARPITYSKMRRPKKTLQRVLRAAVLNCLLHVIVRKIVSVTLTMKLPNIQMFYEALCFPAWKRPIKLNKLPIQPKIHITFMKVLRCITHPQITL